MDKENKAASDKSAILGEDCLTRNDAEDIGDLGNDLDDPDDLLATAREAEHLLNHEDQKE